mmetsp:Transcript_3233/g.8283  ORF Transcript_3233/g.8283 Transcript_3233/m.8283 type:complete len:221 (-) Transcript_3233:108-770(-)
MADRIHPAESACRRSASGMMSPRPMLTKQSSGLQACSTPDPRRPTVSCVLGRVFTRISTCDRNSLSLSGAKVASKSGGEGASGFRLNPTTCMLKPCRPIRATSLPISPIPRTPRVSSFKGRYDSMGAHSLRLWLCLRSTNFRSLEMRCPNTNSAMGPPNPMVLLSRKSRRDAPRITASTPAKVRCNHSKLGISSRYLIAMLGSATKTFVSFSSCRSIAVK